MNIRMSTKGKRPLRSLTPSDKIHAIQRIHDGESKASVARDIGVPESTLRGWCKNEDKLRFMSRQSVSDKIVADAMSDGKTDVGAGMLGGPTDKRQKIDTSLPLNFSNKLKYDEAMSYKRSPLNGLDYATNKILTDLSFNALTAAEYPPFNGGGAVKNKMFGADVSRQTDPSMAAISPLSSLTHLSGVTGMSQSQLGISFNDFTTNFQLLAQLNPGFAAMSDINGLAGAANSMRNSKTKIQTLAHSPHTENEDRQQQGLSVKNWAKQKTPLAPLSNDNNYGLNLTQSDAKNKIKGSSSSLAPSISGSLQTLPPIPENPLMFWLKSQQAMLELNSLYPPPPPPLLDETSPPIRSSTPQQLNHLENIASIAATSLTPVSAPSGSLDDKNIAWLNWCKAFGASLNSMTPSTAAATSTNALLQPPVASNAIDRSASSNSLGEKAPFENILYSHLTKETSSPSIHNDMRNNEAIFSNDVNAKPEDLSAKVTKASSPNPSPSHSPSLNRTRSPFTNPPQSPLSNRSRSPTLSGNVELNSTSYDRSAGSIADCKDVLDNILYKINNNPNMLIGSTITKGSLEGTSDSDASCNSDNPSNNDDNISNNNNNNNNNSNKTDEECSKCIEPCDEEEIEAIKHGEKFLKWLEKCSNPRVTAVHLMQLRFLISAIKSSGDSKGSTKDCGITSLASSLDADIEEDISEDASRNRVRRRK